VAVNPKRPAMGPQQYSGVPADEVGESRAAPKNVLQVLSLRRSSIGRFSFRTDV
jgi:hypothetical protein